MVCKKTFSRCLVLALLLAAIMPISHARAEAIRELVYLTNAVEFPAEGTGIVTGLAGTGDRNPAALELLRKYLGNNNFDFEPSDLALGNIALVRVWTKVSPFSRAGNKMTVYVSSLGNARSLAGGDLLKCDLFADGIQGIVARATGQVVVGDGIATRGMVTDGALQLINYPLGNVMNREGVIRLNLYKSNWSDAHAIARQINQTPALNPYLQETIMFAEAEDSQPVAYAKDSGQVLVRIPEVYRHELTRYIGDIMNVPVAVDRPAKIVANRSKNSIVITGDIKVNSATISIQDKQVTINPATLETPATYALNDDTPRSVIEIDGPGTYADMQGLIDTLNAMGVTTAQVINIFQELVEAGVIHADFIDQ